MTHDELDLVVMGQVMAGCFSSETFRKQERSRSFTIFHHNGSWICQKTFLFLHTMGYRRFKAIKASFVAKEGYLVSNATQGRAKLTLNQIQDVVQFVVNYAGMYTAVEMRVCLSACMYVCMCRVEIKIKNTWEWPCPLSH